MNILMKLFWTILACLLIPTRAVVSFFFVGGAIFCRDLAEFGPALREIWTEE